jgi:hypothetical protein
MSKPEVEAIMGETDIYFATISLGGPVKLGWTEEPTLFGNEQCLEVTIDPKLGVTQKRIYSVEDSYFQRFLEKLGL